MNNGVLGLVIIFLSVILWTRNITSRAFDELSAEDQSGASEVMTAGGPVALGAVVLALLGALLLTQVMPNSSMPVLLLVLVLGGFFGWLSMHRYQKLSEQELPPDFLKTMKRVAVGRAVSVVVLMVSLLILEGLS